MSEKINVKETKLEAASDKFLEMTAYGKLSVAQARQVLLFMDTEMYTRDELFAEIVTHYGSWKAKTVELVSLLEECVSPMSDECHYDHHGYCQAHFLHDNPCPYSRARKLLKELKSDG